jgi:hypothetical protein
MTGDVALRLFFTGARPPEAADLRGYVHRLRIPYSCRASLMISARILNSSFYDVT